MFYEVIKFLFITTKNITLHCKHFFTGFNLGVPVIMVAMLLMHETEHTL
jgi:hypothetical protein